MCVGDVRTIAAPARTTGEPAKRMTNDSDENMTLRQFQMDCSARASVVAWYCRRRCLARPIISPCCRRRWPVARNYCIHLHGKWSCRLPVVSAEFCSLPSETAMLFIYYTHHTFAIQFANSHKHLRLLLLLLLHCANKLRPATRSRHIHSHCASRALP